MNIFLYRNKKNWKDIQTVGIISYDFIAFIVCFKIENSPQRNWPEYNKFAKIWFKSWKKGSNGLEKVLWFYPENEKVKVSEMKTCAFIYEQNISIKTIDLLTDTLKSAFNDSAIAQNFKCKRTKATAIIKNVLGKTIFEEFLESIKSSSYFR